MLYIYDEFCKHFVGISATEYFSAKRGDIVLTFICNDCRNRPTTPDISLNLENVAQSTLLEASEDPALLPRFSTFRTILDCPTCPRQKT
ncbi:hypothetical protein DPMN_107439 [Dreissena polymorpha]|uniref:Uncharacterized protein n=1 Tax=Dreissena polymorpha TaxID=45954 RepID=A0A9D4QKY2_DREPO|nr:hypothetical protein DPMN_107439 [Dreissena polymorpha]